MKMGLFGIQFKCLTQNKISHGLLDSVIVTWDKFTKDVYLLQKKMIYLNFLIKSFSETPNKILFKKEKSN